jgi:hypothetical protein
MPVNRLSVRGQFEGSAHASKHVRFTSWGGCPAVVMLGRWRMVSCKSSRTSGNLACRRMVIVLRSMIFLLRSRRDIRWLKQASKAGINKEP